MDRLRRLLRQNSYEPLEGSATLDGEPAGTSETPNTFSWLNYSVFALLGVSMLWAWNMFLAGAPYFKRRFESNKNLDATFQPTELSVSTVTNLVAMLVLTRLQTGASYPKRILSALAINFVTFTLLALSTKVFTGVSVGVYFGFFIISVFASSLATALCQNGVFAYVAGFGREEYTQAIMMGQAIAGVLPCIVGIVSALSVSPQETHATEIDNASSTSAFFYFLTATIISGSTAAAFLVLTVRHDRKSQNTTYDPVLDNEEDSTTPLKARTISQAALLRKLRWPATALFLTFGTTMFYPVFTKAIESVQPKDSARLFHPDVFIPLAFLLWNSGDLIGRLITAIPALSLTSKPKVLFFLALARMGFIPLYKLCNVGGRGAVISSDAFYLIAVQLLFGLSNGFVGSSCMMGVIEWVDTEEREAAGGLMSLCLVAGLTAGSLLSFAIATV